MPDASRRKDSRPSTAPPADASANLSRFGTRTARACAPWAIGLFLASLVGAKPAVEATNQTMVGPLNRSEWIVRTGTSPIEAFRMTRLARDTPPASFRGALLLLPPFGATFELYEQRDANDLFGTSIAEFFAARGFDVWGYSPRYAGIPGGTCEAGVLDCTPIADWDLFSMVEDVGFVRSQIERHHPGAHVVALGMSSGAMLSIAVANADGARYTGIVPWEGILESTDPAVQALNTGYCEGLEAELEKGVIFDATSTALRRDIGQHATAKPKSLTPIPLFPPQLTNYEVLVDALIDPRPGPMSKPAPGFQHLASTPGGDAFAHADGARLNERFGGGLNDYIPHAALRDVSCALAGKDTTHTANLHLFAGDVLMIGGGRAFGRFMDDQAAAFTSASSVTLRVEPDFGHTDHFFTDAHRRYIELPIFHWLDETLGW